MRYIVAVQLHEELRDEVSRVQQSLRSEFSSYTWLEPEQLFLAIKFLGNPRRRVNQLSKMLTKVGSQVAPFEIKLNRVGCFPESGAVKTIWVNLKSDSAMYQRLMRECQKEFAKIFEDEIKEFIPHIVLGRIQSDLTKGKLRKAVERLSVEEKSQSVKQIELIQSTLGKTGVKYSSIAQAPLSAMVAS